MAKKNSGLQFDPSQYFDRRVIAVDKSGVPWLVDPDAGTIRPVSIILPAEGEQPKQSAVKVKKRK